MTANPVLLIVHDDAAMCRLLHALVCDLSLEVRDCQTATAVSIADSLHPDWIVLDLTHAGGDGLSLTRNLAAMRGAARIVALVPRGDTLLGNAAIEAGAYRWMPVDLLLPVRALLAGSPSYVSDSSNRPS